jgi:addiction module RelE/StbE family toxin
MTIDFHKEFCKRLVKLTPNQKKRVAEVLKLFEKNPHDPQLRNHALHGDQKGNRAIAVGGDLRLVFREENHYEWVIFLSVGTHTQVYE